MARRLSPGRLVIASHNEGKVREIESLLAPFGMTVISAGALGLPVPEETETSFAGNARIKSLAAAQGAGSPALADDSGLEVEALGGAPGVYSADWAEAPGRPRDFGAAMARVARELARVQSDNNRARFVCCLSLAWPDGHTEEFLGEVRGVISFPPRGDRGFGYDPIFTPDGYAQTFGEMDPEQKHRLSHRADAFRKLVTACFDRPGLDGR